MRKIRKKNEFSNNKLIIGSKANKWNMKKK